MYTLDEVELELPGPLPLTFARRYSSFVNRRDVGLGWGWVHSWAWEVDTSHPLRARVYTDTGTWEDFPAIADGQTPLRGVHHVLVEYLPDGFRHVYDSTRTESYGVNEHGLLDMANIGGSLTTSTFRDDGASGARPRSATGRRYAATHSARAWRRCSTAR